MFESSANPRGVGCKSQPVVRAHDSLTDPATEKPVSEGLILCNSGADGQSPDGSEGDGCVCLRRRTGGADGPARTPVTATAPDPQRLRLHLHALELGDN